MFNRLQHKWKVGGRQLLLILCTFAIGGSLTGYAGKWVMSFTGLDRNLLWFIIYIILVTLLWPVAVLLVSIPFGQFRFFTRYLRKMGTRLKIVHPEQGNLIRLAVFASGAGSNAQKIIDHFRSHPGIRVSLIVCNKPAAGVVNIAAHEKIPLLLIEKEAFFRGAYVAELRQAGIDFIVLAGFLWKIPASLVAAYPRAIVNIHPALLPSYGGKGMYGNFVHEAVITARERQSGITIHYVDEHYDNGDIIYQATVDITPYDTPATLAQKIHKLEHQHFPRVIEEAVRTRFHV